MDFLTTYILPFVVVLSVLVFIHEWGHYIVARMCGVKVQTFSIGFGKEIFGRTDKKGTRWKFSWIPLGGYVQMFGDADPASTSLTEEAKGFTDEEKKVAFYSQSVGKRSAILFAGPAINFIFAIFVLTALFAIKGQQFSPPVASSIVEGSAAEKAGMQPDDKIISINGALVERFQDVSQYVAVNLDKEMEIILLHATAKGEWKGEPVTIHLTPTIVENVDRFGFKHQTGRMGIKSPAGFEMKSHTLPSAFVASLKEVSDISTSTLKSIGQMIMGTRKADELGGILRIGAYAGEFASHGIVSLITFAALLSVNLGLINLLPIPMLDGGHLAFYAMEKLKGKPMGERVQEYALRVGLTFLLGIMLFATWNDLVQLKVFDHIKNLVL
jgi:regulator of sigma E protease